jgi:hypothetical protein
MPPNLRSQTNAHEIMTGLEAESERSFPISGNVPPLVLRDRVSGTAPINTSIAGVSSKAFDIANDDMDIDEAFINRFSLRG